MSLTERIAEIQEKEKQIKAEKEASKKLVDEANYAQYTESLSDENKERKAVEFDQAILKQRVLFDELSK